ncbi:MAG: hypothetical protein ABIP75_03125 [Pyrinomonadaceae bacterium]
MKRNPTKIPLLPLLSSYAYLREEPAARELAMSRPDVELLLDCGAFTALNAGKEIALKDYIAFLHEHKANLFGYIALDKLQDPVTTELNLKIMLSEGLKPIPVHVLGDTERRMDELFEYSDWVAFGGLRRPHRGPAPTSYVKQKMTWAKGRKAHWLGYTQKRMLETFRPYSCDCSSWAAGGMYGRVLCYLGNGEWITMSYAQLRKNKLHDNPKVRRALDYYEIEVRDLLDPAHWHNGNAGAELPAAQCVLMKLPARSFVRYVLEFRRKFGTRFFIACHGKQVDLLLNAYDLVKRKGLGPEN